MVLAFKIRMQDYSIEALDGDTWPGVTFSYLVNGVVLDLTGATAKMQVRASVGSPVLLELSTSNSGISIAHPTTGVLQINPVRFLIGVGAFVYDVAITLSGGAIHTYVGGRILITGRVTDV